MFGFTPEDFGPTEVWPENTQVVWVFRKVATQWRMGMAGPIGLDYNVLFRLLDDEAGSDQVLWYEMLEDIAIMEGAAITAMRPRDGGS
jgi:hypothetical protein